MKSKRLLSLPERPIFSVFCTAGFPRLRDTKEVLTRLAAAGVDMIELGFPFSDPVADGPTIQESNLRALRNGMTLSVLFDQLTELRRSVDVPVLLMGYLNPAEQFGFERFISEAARCGVDGLIIPDMPFEEYQDRYKPLYREYGISPVFLVTSRTDEDRIRSFDAEDPAFLYILSSDAVTGGALKDSRERDAFFERLAGMGLKSKLIVGFGVGDAPTFKTVTRRTHGAIVGSAFIKAIATVEARGADAERSDFARSSVIESFVQSFQETR
jgi:tryptophan synthase alpha chain